jgi:hypothetical protein
MERDHPGWIVLSRELAGDLVDLAEAEIEATREEIARVWRGAWVAAALVGVAVGLGFWVLALLAYALVAVLERWLAPWGAALVVAGGFLLLALALAAAAWRLARRLENPLDIALRHLREHLEWWRREVSLGAPGPEARPDAGERRRRAP